MRLGAKYSLVEPHDDKVFALPGTASSSSSKAPESQDALPVFDHRHTSALHSRLRNPPDIGSQAWTMSKRENELKLDPGAPRRKSGSVCKCLLVTIALVLASLVFLMIATFVSISVNSIRNPHKWMYQNATLDEIKDLSTVVRPMIDDHQTFDIAATVWIRKPKEEGSEEDASAVLNEDSTIPKETSLGPETVLYSDIVFRNVTLKDKALLTSVKFQVPTTIFKSDDLTNYDLRGSFVLIPSSPSLLDYAVNYSSWISASIKMPPKWPLQFPLGSPTERPQTLSEEIIDALGISIPLVQFLNIRSRCIPSNTTGKKIENGTDESHKDDGLKGDVDDDDIEEEKEDEDDENSDVKGKDTKEENSGANFSSKLTTTKGEPPVKRHPYIVTRTQVRVIDFTRLYNRKAYNKAHKDLKASACARGVSGTNQSWDLCNLPSGASGHSQIRVQLKVPDASTGKNHTEWAYGPYLPRVLEGGPKDMLLVPVNRENCSALIKESKISFSPLPDEEFVNVTWVISYAGRTLGKTFIGNFFGGSPSPFNMTDSEYALVKVQSGAELFHGMHSHRFREDSHPRRFLILVITGKVLGFVSAILDIHYWYTLTSTFGISIPGTAFFAGALFIQYVLAVLTDQKAGAEKSIYLWIISLLFEGIIWLPYPVVMLKAIARADIKWWKGCIPVFRIAQATHKERASKRLDAQIRWRTKAAVLLTITAVYYLLNPRGRLIISWRGPMPPEDKLPAPWIESVKSVIASPLFIGGLLFQVLLNQRSRHFAGMYKSTLAIRLLQYLGGYAAYVPALFGKPLSYPGETVHGLVQLFCHMFLGWQAFMLPHVSQTAEDEDIE